MFKGANVGAVDRVLRLALGALLAVLPFVTSLELWANPAAKWGAVAVGAVLIVTALVRFCPLYRIVGANTCGR